MLRSSPALALALLPLLAGCGETNAERVKRETAEGRHAETLFRLRSQDRAAAATAQAISEASTAGQAAYLDSDPYQTGNAFSATAPSRSMNRRP